MRLGGVRRSPDRSLDRIYVVDVGATVDCEAIRPELLGQPVNSLSSLAFVVAGVWLMRRSGSRWVALGLIATGVGSFLFHGPLAPGGEWIHDVTLAWLLAVVLVEIRGWPPSIHLFGLAALVVAFGLFPIVADPTMAGMASIVVVSVLADDRSARTLLQLASLGAFALLGRLGATGGALCDSASLFQLHALWHIGAAAVVTWWASDRHLSVPVSRSP